MRRSHVELVDQRGRKWGGVKESEALEGEQCESTLDLSRVGLSKAERRLEDVQTVHLC